jgi:hypothetical protein
MTSTNNSDPAIERFFDSIHRLLPAYRYSAISFVTLVHEGFETILRASLRLSITPPTNSKPEISIADLRAAQLALPNAAGNLRNILNALVADTGASIGDHVLKLQPEAPPSHSAYHENAQSLGRLSPYRERLRLSGANAWLFINPRQPELERAIQSQAFDSLSDVLREYDLEDFGHGDRTTFEIVADPVAHIEPTSRIQGSRAEVSVLVAADLSPESFQFVFRNADRREESQRRMLNSHEFRWTGLPDQRRGTASFEVPKGTVLESRALCAGHVQDIAQLADADCLPNPRRRIVELNDSGLTKTIAALTKIKERDDKLRNDFENSVAVLFYLLGFETVRIGGNRKTTDGPDIYARAPSGELLVVESTSGAFDNEKLGKLLTRTKQARERFDSHSPQLSVTRVTAVIVTPRTAEELGSLLSQAEKENVLVLRRSELLDAIERTQFVPDADGMLRRWRNAVTLRFLSNPHFD